MARMMKQQMDHALARLQCIRADLTEHMPQAKVFKQTDLIDALSSGNKKLTPQIIALAVANVVGSGKSRYHSTGYVMDLEEALIAQVFKKEILKEEERHQKALDTYHKRCSKINKEFNRVEDEIVLGDIDRALKLIQDFSKFKV